MPFPLIPTALGVCFCLVWVFIGGMVFRDGQLAAQQDRESEVSFLPPPHRMARSAPGTVTGSNRSRRRPAIRAAS